LHFLTPVCFSKIGGSNFFWSFPAKRDRDELAKLERAQEQVLSLQRRLSESEHALSSASNGREEGDETGSASEQRSAKIAKLSALDVEKKELEKESEILKENNPALLEDLKIELAMVTEGANRWTDNIIACKSYLKKKRGMDGKEADKILSVGAAFDYPEDKIPR
jgi:hypothetical protein